MKLVIFAVNDSFHNRPAEQNEIAASIEDRNIIRPVTEKFKNTAKETDLARWGKNSPAYCIYPQNEQPETAGIYADIVGVIAGLMHALSGNAVQIIRFDYNEASTIDDWARQIPPDAAQGTVVLFVPTYLMPGIYEAVPPQERPDYRMPLLKMHGLRLELDVNQASLKEEHPYTFQTLGRAVQRCVITNTTGNKFSLSEEFPPAGGGNARLAL